MHVPAPHPPWVYDADGRPRDPKVVSFAGETRLSTQDELDVGFAQASHIADMTVATIDRILATSSSPPVIVAFSDHGPAAGFSTITPLASDLEVRASSFMAALTPGHDGLFTDVRPTPVNVFGTLFNAYLGQHIPHQSDSIWAWKGESYIDVVEAPPIEGWTKMTTAQVAAPTREASPRRIALYPVGLAIVLVFELLNVSGVSVFSTGRPFIVAIVGALALSALGRLLLGDRDRGGVFAALWVLALLGSEDVRLGVVIAIATALLLVERYALDPAKQTIRWPRISRILSRVIVVFGIAVVIQGVQAGTFTSIARSVTHETPLRPPPAADVAAASDPDIYLLMLDGHTRPDVLSDLFGGDGAGLTAALEADGFSVAPKSRSNYTQTAETLASMFNQEHLRDVPSMAGLLAQTEDRPPGTIVRDAINDNVTWSFLRDRGYETNSVSSGFEQVALREAIGSALAIAE